MKRLLSLLFIIFVFCGCTAVTTNTSMNTTDNYSDSNNPLRVSDAPTAGESYDPQPAEVDAPATQGQVAEEVAPNLPAVITGAVIKTNLGNITVGFYSTDSPQAVANFVKLAQAGFYDNTKFHRVIKDFMIQGGDPLSKDPAQQAKWGMGGPGYQFADEFNTHKLVRGSLAMANAGPNTNGSQFFIVTAPATPWLDGKHTNFGEIVDGMDVVAAIEAQPTTGSDRPVQDIVILGIEMK